MAANNHCTHSLPVSVMLTIQGQYLRCMGKTVNDVREAHVAVACDLALRALELTGYLDLDAATSLQQMKLLLAGLEVTTTQLLLQEEHSWNDVAAELGGVTRQSLHRRLSRRINALMDSNAGRVPITDAEQLRIPDEEWVQTLRSIEALVTQVREHDYHPSLVSHLRS